MTSLRLDNFSGKPSEYDTEEIDNQTFLSPKFGIVYQIIENKVSVFGNYMNGFKNITPQTIANVDGSNQRIASYDPEHANQLEFGVKTNLFKDILTAAVSYYDISVQNILMADPSNPNSFTQGGAVESKGIELSLIVNPTKGLNIITGISNNKSEVTKETPGGGYLGLRPEQAGPETLLNLWANYTFTEGSLKGFGLGLGGNYASVYKTLNRANIGTFEIPSYTVLNMALSYNTSNFNFALKINNLLNEKYYAGWSTVTPQQLRNVVAGLTYKF